MPEGKPVETAGSHLSARWATLWRAWLATDALQAGRRGYGARPAVGLARKLVWRLDQRLRRRCRIVEFTSDPDCILRIAPARATRHLRLSDGVVIEPGDPIVELHLWNEHLPPMERRGFTVGWARHASRCMRLSLQELARFAAEHPDMAAAKAVSGRVAFSLAKGRLQLDRLGIRYGFDILADPRPRTLGRRLHDIGENLLLWMILWACNPIGIRYGRFLRSRNEVWMSTATLTRRYGGAASDGKDGDDPPPR